ncbi:MAG: hypothetical protein R3E35_11860 [Rhodocyclaceae bacterium]
MTYPVGTTVYVPVSLLPDGERYPTSLYQTPVTAVQDRSAKVRLRDGADSDWIATSKLHRNAGIVIVSVGDFGTEETLLNPLSKSVLQFCRLLLDDSSVTHLRVRAIGELGKWWKLNHAAYSYIVFIGHGAPDSIHFGYGGARTPEHFGMRVFSIATEKKTVISLCCETGKAAFSKKFSGLSSCGHLIAPFHSIHGAIASQFLQTYMCWQLLHGKSTTVAFKKAAETVPGKDIFRLWRNGKHVA